MDKLTHLLSFARVVECGSISSASRELNISQPAVSQHLKNLEAELGLRLLNRTTRSMVLTEAGEQYYQHIKVVLEKLIEAEQSVKEMDQQMVGLLRVSAPLSFSEQPLAQFLIDFKNKYPQLTLDLNLTDNTIDVISTRTDVAIRLGKILDDRLIVRKLGFVLKRLAATPDYLERRGRPQHPDDLRDHEYILCSHLNTTDVIPLTDISGRTLQTKVNGTLIVNNSALVKRMSLAGLGIGLGHQWMLEKHVQNGELEYVLPDWSFDPQDIHAVYPSNRLIPAKVKRFVDELTGHMQTLCAETRKRAICSA